MRRKGRPKRQDSEKPAKGKRGRPRIQKIENDEGAEPPIKRKRGRPRIKRFNDEDDDVANQHESSRSEANAPDPDYALGLHMSSAQVQALSRLVACVDCGEEVSVGIRPTTKGMISELTISCKVCDSQKSTNTPNLVRERKRKHEKKDAVLQKTENINYAHVAAFLDNGLGYSGLRHYCKYFNARCLNEATFVAYSKQVIADVVADGEDFLQQNARIVRRVFESQLESDFIVDLTVSYTTTYHQWGSDFCLVAGAVIELQTGLVIDFDVANMYCHVCKINAKKIVSMTPAEMTAWFTKHQDTCEIREWCDEIDQDNEEGVKEIDPKYLEAFIAKKIWCRSLEKFGFRYTSLVHESDEKIHAELSRCAPYDDVPVIIDTITNSFSRRKSEHSRTAFQNKLKTKCPRERVQTKDRIMYVYAMAVQEYNKFAIGSNIRLRELVRRMEVEEREYAESIGNVEFYASIKDKDAPEEEYVHEMREIGDAFVVEGDETMEVTSASLDGLVQAGMDEPSSDEATPSTNLQNGIDSPLKSKSPVPITEKDSLTEDNAKSSTNNSTENSQQSSTNGTADEVEDTMESSEVQNTSANSTDLNHSSESEKSIQKEITPSQKIKTEVPVKPFRVEFDD